MNEEIPKIYYIIPVIGIAVVLSLLFVPTNADDIYFLNNGVNTNEVALENLTDVVIVNIESGDVLTYNGTYWINANNGTIISLGDLTDVVIISPLNGHYLRYNGTYWVNQYPVLNDNSDVDISSPLSANVLLFNGTHWKNQVVSGDVTISSSGVVTISNNAVDNAEIAPHTSTKITITNKGQLNSAIAYEDEANTFTALQTITRTDASTLNVNIDSITATRSGLQITGAGDATANIMFRRADGTLATPTAIDTNDVIGAFDIRGYDGNAYGQSAFITFFATENWDATKHGTGVRLASAKTGTTATVEMLMINENGNGNIRHETLTIQESGIAELFMIDTSTSAVNDFINTVWMQAKDNAGVTKTYAKFPMSKIVDDTAGSEDLEVTIQVIKAGTLVSIISYDGAGKTNILNSDLSIETLGNGLEIKEGSNATMGTCTLSGGTCTVNTNQITANSRVFLTPQDAGSGNIGNVYVSARTASTSFTITSTDVLDDRIIAWVIIEPA